MAGETTVCNYTIERLSRINVTDLGALYRAVYDTAIDGNYFIRKYDTAYTGVTNIGYIAYDAQHKPIAFYGVQPCYIKYKNKRLLSAQSGDTMTHPQFRLKGLFVELSLRTFELSRRSGIKLIFGFPNQNSYHGMIRHLGWVQTHKMQCFTWKVPTIPLAKWTIAVPVLYRMYSKYCRMILSGDLTSDKGLSNSILSEEKGGVQRDRHYIKYKTYNTTQVIRIANARVWIKIRQDLFVGDIELNGESIHTIIKRLRRLAWWLGTRTIYLHTSPGIKLYELLKNDYQCIPTFPVLFQNLGTDLPIKEIKFTLSDIDIF